MSRTDIRLLLEIARWAFRYTWRVHKNLLLAIILVTVLLGKGVLRPPHRWELRMP